MCPCRRQGHISMYFSRMGTAIGRMYYGEPTLRAFNLSLLKTLVVAINDQCHFFSGQRKSNALLTKNPIMRPERWLVILT